jgi:hypothetical protein
MARRKSVVNPAIKKVYEGVRHPDQPHAAGETIVMVNGQMLSPKASQKLYNHSPTGFSWGYCGSGPAQLALAILLDYYGNPATALRLYQKFKSAIIARFPQEKGWQLTGAEIEYFCENINALDEEE